MSKFSLIIITTGLFLFTTNNISGQSDQYTLALKKANPNQVSYYIQERDTVKIAKGDYLNDINIKAVRNFNKAFQDATEVVWCKTTNGYIANFRYKNNLNTAYYSTTGEWQFTRCCYKEKSMPKDIRALVKRTYYDYTITLVEKFHIQDKTFYVVHMQDETSWKNVQVFNDEMQVVGDFVKSRK